MIDRRNDALDDIVTAIAQSIVDQWIDGEILLDGLEETHNGRTQHETENKTKPPAKSARRAKAKARLRKVRR